MGPVLARPRTVVVVVRDVERGVVERRPAPAPFRRARRIYALHLGERVPDDGVQGSEGGERHGWCRWPGCGTGYTGRLERTRSSRAQAQSAGRLGCAAYMWSVALYMVRLGTGRSGGNMDVGGIPSASLCGSVSYHPIRAQFDPHRRLRRARCLNGTTRMLLQFMEGGSDDIRPCCSPMMSKDFWGLDNFRTVSRNVLTSCI